MSNPKSLFRRVSLMALALVAVAEPREASAVDRKGFIAGLGVGGGKISCEGCDMSGPAVGLHLGGMLKENVALVFDGSGVTKEEGGATFTSVVVGAALQYWASPRVWIKGGVGAGQLQFSGNGVTVNSDAGLGFLGGLGIEALQKKRFTIDLQVRLSTAKIEGHRVTNVFALIGFNLY